MRLPCSLFLPWRLQRFAACICLAATLLIGCAPSPAPETSESTPAAANEPSDAVANEPAATEAEPQPTDAPAETPIAAPQKLAVEHLPNAYQVHAKVISGGLPEGDAAFEELKSLGVKTIITVDGAKPDVETAKKFGMRYVHLPHGYDGVPEDRVKELAKAVRDLDGPIYIHCHHGMHRSPAAAAVACVSAGLIAPEAAKTILETAGTNPRYRGLYQSAEAARPLDGKLLDELKADFPETAPIPPMAEAMIAIEHTRDHLTAFAKNGWERLAKHPDLDPAHEALLLREYFTELMRTDAARSESEGFQKLLAEGEAAAQSLEDAVRAWQADQTPELATKATAALDAVNKNCGACHQTYRDVPLGEKAKQ